jgi:hypothetical protein
MTRLFSMSCALAFALVLSFASHASAATPELVDNPAYKSWADHKPGTSVTFQQQMSVSGMDMTHEITETLKSVAPDKAMVEFNIVMDINGQKHEQKSMHPIAAKVQKGQEGLPPNVKGKMTDAGTEKVDVSGKSYDCKVMDFTGQSQQGPATGKVWESDDMPGCLVKMEMKMEGKMAGSIKMTATSVEMK